jgi:hypothetical protein
MVWATDDNGSMSALHAECRGSIPRLSTMPRFGVMAALDALTVSVLVQVQ